MTQENQPQEITIFRPDDWHVHLRDGEQMKSVVGFTARQFKRALVMPNLKPPITTVAMTMDYRDRILTALPSESGFNPYMTLYLMDNTSVEEIMRAAENPHILGFKLYPAGATTNSDAGINNLQNIYPQLETMEKYGVVLQVHGEVTDPDVDIFDREKMFIERHLIPIVKRFPNLKIVLEHVTTKQGVQFVESCGSNVAATITAHHLLYNRNAILAGGNHPHFYCLPVLKREEHRKVLLRAAYNSINTIKHPKFFLGTDSAPHSQAFKENSCGCAGCFTAYAAIELYTEAFEQFAKKYSVNNWPQRLEQFASFNGADFYGLPRNTETITLIREDWTVPDEYPFGKGPTYHFKKPNLDSIPDDADDFVVIPLRAGEIVHWKLAA